MAVADVLPYFQLGAQLALIAGASFAGYQLLLHRRERNEQRALDVLTKLQGPEFQRAYTQVWDLPLAATPEAVRAGGREMEDAVETVALTFESLGVMAYHRIVPLAVVDNVIGGFLRESWRRVGPYVKWKREQLGAPRWAEWYEWLADRVQAGRRRRTTGAYEAFRDWKESPPFGR
jgi:hypothetical protein